MTLGINTTMTHVDYRENTFSNHRRLNQIMKLITVHIPEAYLTAINQLIAVDAYPNRSEVIRVAIRDLLKNELGGFIQYSQDKSAKIPNLMEE